MATAGSSDTFSIFYNTAQAQAELMRLRTLNAATAATMGATWKGLKGAFILGAAGLGAAAIAAGGAYMAVGEYNRQMSLAAALGGLNTQAQYALGESIKASAKQFGTSSSEIARGSVELIKAGVPPEKVADMIDTVTRAAVANQEDWTSVAEMAVYAVNAFHRSWEDVPELMDEMQMAAKISVLQFSDLQQVLQYTAQSGYMIGTSFESLLAATAILSNAAMEAGIGARSLNQMLIGLISHSDDVQDWIDTMGLGFNLIEDGTIQIERLVEGLAGVTLTLDELQQAREWFNVRGMRSFAVLLGSADKYGEALSRINNSQGELNKTMDQFADTAMTVSLGQVKESFLQIFYDEGIQVALRGLLEQFNDPRLIEGVSKFVTEGIASLVTLMPDLMDMLTSILSTVNDLTPLLHFMARIVADLGDNFFKLFLVWKMIKMMGITDMIAAWTTQTMALNTAEMTGVELAQMRSQAYMGLAKGIGMAVVGAYAWSAATTKEGKAFAALITVLGVVNSLMQTYVLLKSYAGYVGAPGTAGIQNMMGPVSLLGPTGRRPMMGRVGGGLSRAFGGTGMTAATGAMSMTGLTAGMAVAGIGAAAILGYMYYQYTQSKKEQKKAQASMEEQARQARAFAPAGGGSVYVNYNQQNSTVVDGYSNYKQFEQRQNNNVYQSTSAWS